MGTGQSTFRAAVLDPAQPTPRGLTNGAGGPVSKRFDVYRNNVTVGLTDALRTAFPVVEKLLGASNFDDIARRFIRAHPPTSPVMMHYGADMPAFLATFAPVAHIGYLPDVAALELAMRRAYHAADLAPFDAARLGAMSPDALMGSVLTLAPPVEVVSSAWPLFDLWRYNTQPDAPKPQAEAQTVIITRAEFDPVPHRLTPDQAAWMAAIQDGKSLSVAQDAACAHDPDFDLSPLLTLLVTHNAIADFTTPKD